MAQVLRLGCEPGSRSLEAADVGREVGDVRAEPVDEAQIAAPHDEVTGAAGDDDSAATPATAIGDDAVGAERLVATLLLVILTRRAEIIPARLAYP